MSEIVVELRQRLEGEMAVALHARAGLDVEELERLAQRVVEAIAFATSSTPGRVLEELRKDAPSDPEWERLFAPAWRAQAASLAEMIEAERRLTSVIVPALLGPQAPIPGA